MFLRNFLSQFFLVKRLVAHWLWKTMPFEMLDNYWRYNLPQAGEASHPHSILSRLGPRAREHFGGRCGYGGAKKKTPSFSLSLFFSHNMLELKSASFIWKMKWCWIHPWMDNIHEGELLALWLVHPTGVTEVLGSITTSEIFSVVPATVA